MVEFDWFQLLVIALGWRFHFNVTEWIFPSEPNMWKQIVMSGTYSNNTIKTTKWEKNTPSKKIRIISGCVSKLGSNSEQHKKQIFEKKKGEKTVQLPNMILSELYNETDLINISGLTLQQPHNTPILSVTYSLSVHYSAHYTPVHWLNDTRVTPMTLNHYSLRSSSAHVFTHNKAVCCCVWCESSEVRVVLLMLSCKFGVRVLSS